MSLWSIELTKFCFCFSHICLSGSGKLSWAEEDELKHMDLRRGDVYRLLRGTVFFIHCVSETATEQQRLRIHAIFANSNDDLRVQPFFT